MPKSSLTTEQRESIRAMQRSEPYRLLLLEVQASKPSVHSLDAASDNACAKRLHELRGWELCERALAGAADVRPLAAVPDHDYTATVGGDA